jgi:hypothetical protein
MTQRLEVLVLDRGEYVVVNVIEVEGSTAIHQQLGGGALIDIITFPFGLISVQRIPCRVLLLHDNTLLALAGTHERLLKKEFIFIIRDDCIIFSAYN